jgi:hypothetical protein
VNLMRFALWTVRADLFGNVHALSLLALQYRKHAYSYTFSAEMLFSSAWNSL